MFNFNFGGGFPGGAHAHGGGGGGGGGRGRRAAAEADTTKFYDILGLEKASATDAEIKKAFRKQAMTHHPDKGGDPEKFKEISKAYEVLNDPEKKALYDEGGEEALDGGAGGGGGGHGGMDIFDLFGGGFGGGHGGGARAGGKRKGEDVVFPLKVSLEDLFNGTSKKLRLTKNVLCTGCGGKGGAKEATCRGCKGQGIRIVIRQLGPGMIQQMQTACTDCNGTGSTMAEKDKCKKCKGEKTVKEKKTLEVFVNKGMRNGEKIVFAGEADEAPDMIPGDVVVVLQSSEHTVFKRDGSHLFLKKQISLVEALTGFQFTVPHLDGRTLLVKSDPNMIVKPGDIKAIKDEGFPQLKNPYIRGNLYVEFDVKFPEHGTLTDAAKAALLSILPRPEKSEMETASSEAIEEVVLVEVDINEEKKRFESGHREAYEEDEEGGARGRQQQAGCRTQ